MLHREKRRYRGSELHLGGRRCDEAPRKREITETTKEAIKFQSCSSGIIDSDGNNMREFQDL
jgi:hypothetical protein